MAISGPTPVLCFLSNDAEFRSWVTAIHNALIACGQVQTSDTGQINLATVAKPSVQNTAAGYEIWQFNDSLQATAPLVYKIEYGVGSPITMPSMWFTIGAATNGAGTLTGLITARDQYTQGASSAGTTKNLYAGGAANRIWFATGLDFATSLNSVFFMIERTKDATGTDTADGWITQRHEGSSTSRVQSGLWTSGPSGAVASQGCIVPGLSSRFATFSNVAFAPSMYFQGKPFYTTMVGATVTDIPGTLTYPLDYLGATHTYLSLGGALNGNGTIGGQSVPVLYPQVLWE